MTKKKTTKLAALIALLAIFGSIVWTWVLIIFETYFSSNTTKKSLSQTEINELLKNYSWSLTSSWNELNSNTWVINSTLTWTTK